MSQQMSQQSDFLTPNDQTISTKSGADHADDLHNARIMPASKKVKLADGLETIATLRDDLPAGEPEQAQPIVDCSSNPFLQYFPELKVDEAELKKRKRKGARDQGALTTSQMDRDFVYIGEVASGSFGSVVKVRKRMDGCLYAVTHTHTHTHTHAHTHTHTHIHTHTNTTTHMHTGQAPQAPRAGRRPQAQEQGAYMLTADSK
jgi:ABC-type nickel/cobalt efflux system permease component RcnA